MSEFLNLIVLAAIAGGVLYLFNLLPLDSTVKKVANALAIFIIIIWAIRWLIGHLH